MSKTTKKLFALLMAVTIAASLAMPAFAEDTSVSADGSGKYEGGPLKYPALSVTLPTATEGMFDYVGDPNGLIDATDKAAYEDYTFTGDTGIFFLSAEKTYTTDSATLTVTNKNAQDIDVTVSLSQKTAGSEGISYSATKTFDSEDTANKVYLAVVEDVANNAKSAALTSADQAASFTVEVEGSKDNYEAKYNASLGTYGYDEKEDIDESTWKSTKFKVTGALNKNATWGDSVTFPEVTVTWSYAEHQDNVAPSVPVTAFAYSRSADLAINVNLGSGNLGATGIASLGSGSSASGSFGANAASTWSYANGVLTFKAGYFSGAAAGQKRYLQVTFNDTAATKVVIELTIAN